MLLFIYTNVRCIKMAVDLNPEKIQEHPVQDIWRIKDGLLLYVNKYQRHSKYNVFYLSSLNSKNTKIIRGCKGLRELKEDYFDSYSKTTIKKGTLLFENIPIEILSDSQMFKYDIRSSGGSIQGNYKTTIDTLNKIQKILGSY